MVLQRKKQKVKVTPFSNTAILIVKNAQTGLITDNMKKILFHTEMQKGTQEYHNLIRHICVKHYFSFSPSEVSDCRKSRKNRTETYFFKARLRLHIEKFWNAAGSLQYFNKGIEDYFVIPGKAKAYEIFKVYSSSLAFVIFLYTAFIPFPHYNFL